MNLNFSYAGSVISDTIANDTIVINAKTGAYYSLTPLGAEIWTAINANQVSEQQFEVVAILVKEGLVIDLNEKLKDFCFENLQDSDVFDKYTDMESILLADPIHEVDDLGWPKLK